VILAVTSSDTLDAVSARSEKEEWGINYRVVHDKGRAITTAYGIESFPTTYLIGPDGTVLPGGHIPGDEEVEKMLADVKLFRRPEELPRSLAKAGAAFDERQYGAAHKLASRVVEKEDEDSEVAAELVGVVDEIAEFQLARAAKAAEAREFIKVIQVLERMQVEFKGSDHADAAKDAAKEYEKAYPDGWKGSELYLKLEGAVAGKKRDKDRAKLAPAYRQLAARYPGTWLARMAQKRATELEALD
jgi:hypothetical protein